MDKNMQRALEQTESALQYLEKAEEMAELANAAWNKITSSKYVQLLGTLSPSDMAKSRRKRAIARLIAYVAGKRFPGLPCSTPICHQWAKKAMDAHVALPHISNWFAGQVAPTAEEEIWKHMLNEAQKMLSHVGSLRLNRREAVRWGRRLGLRFHTRNSLRGLEAVISRMANSEIPTDDFLLSVVDRQERPGRSATGWNLAPHIQTFRNDRFDIWLRDDELACRVKDILETNVEKL